MIEYNVEKIYFWVKQGKCKNQKLDTTYIKTHTFTYAAMLLIIIEHLFLNLTELTVHAMKINISVFFIRYKL